MKSSYYESHSKAQVQLIREGHRKYFSKGSSPVHNNIRYMNQSSSQTKEKGNASFFQQKSPNLEHVNNSRRYINGKVDLTNSGEYFKGPFKKNSRSRMAIGQSDGYDWQKAQISSKVIERKMRGRTSHQKGFDSSLEKDSVLASKKHTQGLTDGSKISRSEEST